MRELFVHFALNLECVVHVLDGNVRTSNGSGAAQGRAWKELAAAIRKEARADDDGAAAAANQDEPGEPEEEDPKNSLLIAVPQDDGTAAEAGGSANKYPSATLPRSWSP